MKHFYERKSRQATVEAGGMTVMEILRNRETWAKEALKRNPTSNYHKGYLEATQGTIRLLESNGLNFEQ